METKATGCWAPCKVRGDHRRTEVLVESFHHFPHKYWNNQLNSHEEKTSGLVLILLRSLGSMLRSDSQVMRLVAVFCWICFPKVKGGHDKYTAASMPGSV